MDRTLSNRISKKSSGEGVAPQEIADVRVQARMNKALKTAAEEVFEEIGISATEAIRMFYAQVKLHQGLPFDLRIPNETTLAALEETEHPEKLASYADVDTLFDNL